MGRGTMGHRERMMAALEHRQPDRVPIDFDGTPVSGMHISVVGALREYYGLEKRPVKLHEPLQCLGYIDDDLAEIIGADAVQVGNAGTFFGYRNEGWRPWKSPWGQDVLVPENFAVTTDDRGNTWIYPGGDTSVPPSGHMPEGGFYFDEVIRQDPLPDDDEDLKVEDNLEEFAILSVKDLDELEAKAKDARATGKLVIGNFGGTGLGDIAVVPAPMLKHPKGIRDITEWYISTAVRQPLLHQIYEKQYDMALENLENINSRFGEMIDVVFICGTDFGTQNSTFCSKETYRELYMPHYKRLNGWIHEHTGWKSFKHCCGSVPTFMPLFIESGFDIINPVQVSATGMDPAFLKREFGNDLVFWGGGVDTQRVLPFGTPEEVREQVLRHCEIFNKDGGFVFNTIHNVQSKTPVENLVAMFDAIKEFDGR
jgi:hypothetical protein